MSHWFLAGWLLAISGMVGAQAPAVSQSAKFRDPLDVPAAISPIANRAPMIGAAAIPGGRLVAVGRRGIIVTSDDGANWKQAKVPVSTDLVAVQFPTAKQGWAVGHGGVVLHSADGGLSWQKQIDGRKLPQMLIAHFKPLADSGDEAAKAALADAQRYAEDGPGRPLLDVWFDDESHGMVVGAYNLALRTEDGGASWQVISDRIDNPQGLHLYGLANIGGTSWIAGEQGLLLKADPATGRYSKVSTPYPGTFFALAGGPGVLVVVGLRGNALRSTDGGVNWLALQTTTQSSLTTAAVLPGGGLALAGLGGEVLFGNGDGQLKGLPIEQPMPLYRIVAAGKNRLLLAGSRGVRVESLSPASAAANPLSQR